MYIHFYCSFAVVYIFIQNWLWEQFCYLSSNTVKWSEAKVLLKIVCYTCELTTLETRYCSFYRLCCFSYVHFVLICTHTHTHTRARARARVCVCVCGFCNVCVCEGFVMCGCFSNMYTGLWLRFFLTWLRFFLPCLRFFLPCLRFFRAFSLVVRQMPG